MAAWIAGSNAVGTSHCADPEKDLRCAASMMRLTPRSPTPRSRVTDQRTDPAPATRGSSFTTTMRALNGLSGRWMTPAGRSGSVLSGSMITRVGRNASAKAASGASFF